MFYFKGDQASKFKVGNRSWKNGHVRMLYVKILKLKKIQRKLAGKCLFFCRLDESFWQKTSSVIDVKKERVWTALLDGFEKYLAVLTERASLIQETDALKQQVSGERLGTKARGRVTDVTGDASQLRFYVACSSFSQRGRSKKRACDLRGLREKRRGSPPLFFSQTPLVTRALCRSSSLTGRLEQARFYGPLSSKGLKIPHHYQHSQSSKEIQD